MRHSYADNVFLLGLTFLLGWRREDYFNMGKLLAGAEAKTSEKQPKSVICPPVISGTNSLKLPALQLRKIDVLQMTAWSSHAYFLCSAVSPEESIAAGVAVTVLNLKQERSQLCSYRSAARFSIGEVPVAPVTPVARTVTRTYQTMRRILITMRGELLCLIVTRERNECAVLSSYLRR